MKLNKKILIYGGSSFIAQNIVSHFKALNYSVDAVVRNKNFYKTNRYSNMHILNQRKKDDLVRVYKNNNYDIVIHAAGTSTVYHGNQNPDLDYKSNVITTIKNYEALRDSGCNSKFIYLSSSAIYGNSLKDLKEDDVANPLSVYGKNKLKAEGFLQNNASKDDIPLLILRIFSVYGEGLKKQVMWDAVTKLTTGNNSFKGTGAEIRDFVSVADVIDFIDFAIKKDKTGVFNVGTGKATTIMYLIKKIARFIEYKDEILFDGNYNSFIQQRVVANIEKARSSGWESKYSIDDELEDYLKWIMQELRIKK